MGDFFSALIAKLVAVVTWFSDLFKAVFVAIWSLVKDAFAWVLEQLLGIVKTAIAALDITPFATALSSAGTLPAEILNVLGLLGVGTAISIILSAIGIRMLLQLIPFVRLGS